MNPVRNIFNDLVDRRLWPVALALVAALVAVPVLLGGSKPATVAPAQVAEAPATAGTAQAAISVSQVPTTPVDRAGSVRNPFVQHMVMDTTATTTSVTTTSAPTSGAASSPAPSAGAPLTPVSGGQTTLTPVPVTGGGKPAVQDVYRVNLRFGAAGNQKVRHDIPRLTPLPSISSPFFVFLGVLADHKTAVFLVSSDATATGDGTCKPNPSQCDTIELKAGDTEFFDVANGNAGSTQYELDLLKITHGKVKGTAAAARAARRVSSDGKTVVHELKAEGDKSMGRYIYSFKRGILVRRHGARAAVSATASSTGFTPAHSSGVLGASWGP